MGLCAVASALPIPWLSEPSDFYLVGILFWLLLFFGGFILPPVTGIMINSVGEFQRASANSIANLCYNLLGYLPAPSVYGLIAAATKIETPSGGNKSRWSMGVLLYSTIFTIGSLIYGINKKISIDDEKRRNSTIVLTREDEEHGDVNQRLIEKKETNYDTFENKKPQLSNNNEDTTTGFDGMVSNQVISSNNFSDPLTRISDSTGPRFGESIKAVTNDIRINTTHEISSPTTNEIQEDTFKG